jgi:hypothetical protein
MAEPNLAREGVEEGGETEARPKAVVPRAARKRGATPKPGEGAVDLGQVPANGSRRTTLQGLRATGQRPPSTTAVRRTSPTAGRPIEGPHHKTGRFKPKR